MIFAKMKENKASATISACVSILVSLSLIFAGLQLYRITSTSASSQETSDAAALSGSSQVAKFYFVANVADGSILAMNITQLVTYSLAVVAAASGNVASSADFLAKANDIGSARQKFSTSAKKSLNAYQKALPAVACASASKVAQSNSSDSSSYSGVCTLIPDAGENIDIDDADLSSASDHVNDNIDELQEEGKRVKEQEEKLDKLKSSGYKLDCGDNPSYCLYERAKSLSSMSDSDNPYYTSPDTWDFNVAFNRSLAYFANRSEAEEPSSYSSVRDKARSCLRADYYEYCADELRKSKEALSSTSEIYTWPDLYHDIDTFKSSSRYTESIYPITEVGGKQVMHSNGSLDCARGFVGKGSCADWDSGGYEMCEMCEFSSDNVAKVGSATTNTKTGFEHYYHLIKDLCNEYKQQEEDFESDFSKLKDKTKDFFDRISEFFNAAKKARIKVSPPGKDGVISIVADSCDITSAKNFQNPFIKSDAEIGPRVAFSGAVLKNDSEDSGISLVSGRIVSLAKQSTSPLSLIWQQAAYAFSDGTKALKDTFETASSSSLVKGFTSSIAGKWAMNFMSEFAASLGLEPADMSAYKPVVEGTSSIVSGSDCNFARVYSKLQDTALENSSSETGVFGAFCESLRGQLKTRVSSSNFDIAIAKLPVIGEISLNTSFDEEIVDYCNGKIDEQIDEVEDLYASSTRKRTWK